ncbi:hypothetical protein [Methylobacterium sp. WL9]|uniref:hypothetical protein n=1 Tax=Methylobacterium sp. WL9 TaxID=2603898 RepID=UPI0011CB47C7|nr:hypothetical protein [Methylobacterium sp. WL9]TXN22149.1 hypothetical protein FV217_11785 [Methylobacterium sp. WL9]
MSNTTCIYKFVYIALSLFVFPSTAFAESGYQTIRGTRVYTVIDQSAGVATFSNECGSQTLTQRQLQSGSIPSQIIPCPRDADPQDSNDTNIKLANLSIDRIHNLLVKDAFGRAIKEAKDTLLGTPERSQQYKILSELYEMAICFDAFYDASTPVAIVSAINRCKHTSVKNQFIKYSSYLAKEPPKYSFATRGLSSPTFNCKDIEPARARDSDCDSSSGGMTSGEPWNHGSQDLKFRDYSGKIWTIPPGHSIFRNRDGGIGVTDLRDSSKNQLAVSQDGKVQCKNLSASYGVVLLSCERERQAKYWYGANENENVNDAYDNYMKSRNSNTSGRNNGDLN